MAHQGYGFCEFLTEEDAEYACKIMNQIKLWGKPIRVNKASCFERGFTVLSNPIFYAGIIRQKTTGCGSKPFHRQLGRERGRATVIRYFQRVWYDGYDSEGMYPVREQLAILTSRI